MVSQPEPAMDTVGETLGARGVAFLVDALLVGLGWSVLWGVGVAVRSAVDGSLSAIGGGVSLAGVVVWLLTWLLVAGFAFAYFAASHAVAGQTVGKRIGDVVVVSRDGEPCDSRAAAVRTAVLLAPAPLVALLVLLTGLVGAFAGAALVVGWVGLELAVAAVDDRNQRIGDRLADTVVASESLATV